MILKRALFFILPIFIISCAQVGEHKDLKIESQEIKIVKKSDVVILGGSVAGITAASKIRDFDQSINISFVEKNEEILTEPLLNLYIAGKIDKNMIHDSYEEISKKHQFEIIASDTLRIDDENKKLYFDDFILEYKLLADTRYAGADCNKTESMFICNDYGKIENIREKLSCAENIKVLIDASGLEDDEMYRAYELFALLSSSRNNFDTYFFDDNKKSSNALIPAEKTIREKEGIEGFKLIIAYPEYDTKTADGARYRDNFFKQYNEGEYLAAEIVKKLKGVNYIPNIIKEESFIIIDTETLRMIDAYSSEELDTGEILAKIKRIKLEIM